MMLWWLVGRRARIAILAGLAGGLAAGCMEEKWECRGAKDCPQGWWCIGALSPDGRRIQGGYCVRQGAVQERDSLESFDDSGRDTVQEPDLVVSDPGVPDPGWIDVLDAQDAASDVGRDPGVDPGIWECPLDKDCTGRVCGPDPKCQESCGQCIKWADCNSDGRCIDRGGCGERCDEMVPIPAGDFWQGCYAAIDVNCSANEWNYHLVTTPPYRIDRFEATVGMYAACYSAGSCEEPKGTSSYCNWGRLDRTDHPVNCITWDQARRFCAWAGKRLCSESEWEKAARGTKDGRLYPWGNEDPTCKRTVKRENGYGCGTDSTWPVGSIPDGRSPFDVMDMAGNVLEWVADVWHDSYDGAEPNDGSPWGGESVVAEFRVGRGGSFDYGELRDLRTSARIKRAAGDGEYDAGVRCCSDDGPS